MKTSFKQLFKSLLLGLLILSNIYLSSCSNQETELKMYLDSFETRYENIAQELGIAYWNYYSKEAEADLISPKDKFTQLLANDTLNQIIEEWYPKSNEIKDTILKHRVEIWHRVLVSAKVEYDPEIMALRNELEGMLEVKEEDENTEYNFDEKMLQLIRLRNSKSVELGYENYVHLTFETNGLGYDWFLNFVDKMEEETLEPYQVLVQEIKEENGIEKFDQMSVFQIVGQFYRNNEPSNLKEENIIELLKQSLADIGIDYNELPAKLVEMDLPPGIGGQGLMINIPNDFRAVMALGMDISTWMHEMGHGLHGLYNSINSPILEGYEWVPGNATGAFAEGMAETSAWLTRNVEWQKKYTNLSEEEIMNKKEIVQKYSPGFIRYHLYSFMRETELYLNPKKTYEKIQNELAKKYLLIETEEIRTQDLKNIIYVSYPLYIQSYLIADIVASQVHTALEEKFGKDYAFNKDVGNYLIKSFYNTGEYYSWNERMIMGTGKELDLDAYLMYYKIN